MNVSGWEDPNLKPTSEKIGIYIRNNFIKDPYLHRMFDTRAKGLIQHIPMASFLHAQEQANEYKRKYQGDFFYSDFFDSNKLRLLCLNFGELFGLKNNLMSHELKSFSRNFFRGPLQGYLLNTASYAGVYGHAAYRAGRSQDRFVPFMITTFFSALALSPIQYLAFMSWNNYNRQLEPTKNIMLSRGIPGLRKPLFAHGTAVMYQRFFSFMPASVVFTSMYGVSVYLNNVDNIVLNALYYPSLVAAYLSLSLSGLVMKAVQQETNFVNIRYYNLPKEIKVNPAGLGLFLALNTLLPLKIDQLRGKDEFKHAYLEFVSDSEDFKPKETMYA